MAPFVHSLEEVRTSTYGWIGRHSPFYDNGSQVQIKRAFAFVDVHESNCLNASRDTAMA